MKPLLCPHCGKNIHDIPSNEIFKRPNGQVVLLNHKGWYFEGWELAAENVSLTEVLPPNMAAYSYAHEVLIMGYHDARKPMRK